MILRKHITQFTEGLHTSWDTFAKNNFKKPIKNKIKIIN